jgi:hypothetical protein
MVVVGGVANGAGVGVGLGVSGKCGAGVSGSTVVGTSLKLKHAEDKIKTIKNPPPINHLIINSQVKRIIKLSGSGMKR